MKTTRSPLPSVAAKLGVAPGSDDGVAGEGRGPDRAAASVVVASWWSWWSTCRGGDRGRSSSDGAGTRGAVDVVTVASFLADRSGRR